MIATSHTDAAQSVQPRTNSTLPEPTWQQVKDTVNRLNILMQESTLAFSLLDASDANCVALTDAISGNAIMQYPPNALMTIAQTMHQLRELPTQPAH